MHTGQCHCGNVSLTIPGLSEKAVRCNCSICSRYAAIWGFFEAQDVNVSVGKQGISEYCQGDKTIAFIRCNNCHSITHYVSVESSPEARLAVNYRMFDVSLLKDMEISYFDGANTWCSIEKENWIYDG